MLERKTRTDRIRQVLAVLDRWEFLFALPGRVQENIAQEEYSKVYAKGWCACSTE